MFRCGTVCNLYSLRFRSASHNTHLQGVMELYHKTQKVYFRAEVIDSPKPAEVRDLPTAAMREHGTVT